MFRNFLFSSVLLGFVAVATAAPITFTNPEYSVYAFAGVGPAVLGFDENEASSALPPLNVNASFSTAAGSAFASASAALGNLSAVTNVTSRGVDSKATSNSEFSGTIDSLLGGSYQLAFNFVTGNDIVGEDSFASSTLAISISSIVNNLLYDKTFITNKTLTDFTFSLAPNTKALFDILLISNAESSAGSASNTSNVNFAINAVNGVPEPHEGMLLLLGGLAMCSFIWRGRRRKGSSLA